MSLESIRKSCIITYHIWSVLKQNGWWGCQKVGVSTKKAKIRTSVDHSKIILGNWKNMQKNPFVIVNGPDKHLFDILIFVCHGRRITVEKRVSHAFLSLVSQSLKAHCKWWTIPLFCYTVIREFCPSCLWLPLIAKWTNDLLKTVLGGSKVVQVRCPFLKCL